MVKTYLIGNPIWTQYITVYISDVSKILSHYNRESHYDLEGVLSTPRKQTYSWAWIWQFKYERDAKYSPIKLNTYSWEIENSFIKSTTWTRHHITGSDQIVQHLPGRGPNFLWQEKGKANICNIAWRVKFGSQEHGRWACHWGFSTHWFARATQSREFLSY